MFESIVTQFAATCAHPPNFFGFPVWYRYLSQANVAGNCEITNFQISDIPLVALALVEIALRVAALVAVGYIMYGGIQFVVAQGESDKTKKARQTVINALIGLVIALSATAIVAFIGSRLV